MGKFIPVEPEKWAEMVKAWAENVRLETENGQLQTELARLKAEVERLRITEQNQTDRVISLEDCIQVLKQDRDGLLYEESEQVKRLKAEVERLTTWQPIETLPMFQEALIVCDGLCGIYFGTRYKSGVDSSQVDVEKYKPTHWMPLPTEPAKKGGQP